MFRLNASKGRSYSILGISLMGLLLLGPSSLKALTVSNLANVSVKEQIVAFFSLSDAGLRQTLLGFVFLGINAGMLGSFVIVKRLSLIGDMLAHAVLPGVALGFLWHMRKDSLSIFLCASFIGLLGTFCLHWIQAHTRIKKETALALILSGFYACGICMMSALARIPSLNQAGLQSFLFGQAAALSAQDIALMGWMSVITTVFIVLFYKELLSSSFDPIFSQTVLPLTRYLHYLFLAILSFSVVVCLQATGVILISAMLVIPCATATLITRSMPLLIMTSVLLSILSSVSGAFVSYLKPGLPTGPFIVVSSFTCFMITFLCHPQRGLLIKRWRLYQRRQLIQVENYLKALYQALERSEFKAKNLNYSELTRLWGDAERIPQAVRQLSRKGFIRVSGSKQTVSIALTEKGWNRAEKLVRNHRLWERYLTDHAHYASDHVHDNAEIVEHFIGDKLASEIQKSLNFPDKDPHGKPIPGP